MPIIPAGISASTVAAIGAGVSAAGSLAGGLINSGSASSAAGQQQAATNESLAQQAAQFAYSQGQEQPYIEQGDNALNQENAWQSNYGATVEPALTNLLTLGNSATAQQALAQTPGYTFTLNQGLQATQNAAAARGLGVSGAALKGAATFATGLADNTYQQQYNNASNNLVQAQNAWSGFNNSLANTAQLGGNVSVSAGTQGQNATTNSTNLLTSNGNSQAASTIAQGNALAGGVTSVGNSVGNYNQALQLQSYLSSNGSQYSNTQGGVTSQSGYLNSNPLYSDS